MKTIEIVIEDPRLAATISELAERYGVTEEEMITRLLKAWQEQQIDTPRH